jgi:hypothetical protein
MRFRAFVALAGLAVGASGSTALATTFMEMQSQPYGFPLSPGNQTLFFNQFDDLGGTRLLKAVELQFSGSMQAQVTAENDSALLVNNFGVNMTGFVSVDVNGGLLTGNFGLFDSEGPVAAGASDGVPDSGPDFFDFGLLSDSGNDSDIGFPLAAWIGGGTFPANIMGSGGFATSGTSDATIKFSNFGTSGDVKVIYYYDIVPTPGAAALFGFAGFAAFRRRR